MNIYVFTYPIFSKKLLKNQRMKRIWFSGLSITCPSVSWDGGHVGSVWGQEAGLYALDDSGQSCSLSLSLDGGGSHGLLPAPHT